MPATMNKPRAFTPKQVADMLQVTRRQVYNLLEKGELKSARIGNRHRIFLNHLEDYLGEEEAHSLVKGMDGND